MMMSLLTHQPEGCPQECQPSKQTTPQSPVYLPTGPADSSEPRTPDNEPPASMSRQGAGSPTGTQHDAASTAGPCAAGEDMLDVQILFIYTFQRSRH
jgi:hypothetical protein